MPKVSILMPTRERIELAKRSIASLGNHDLEILLAVDENDPQLYEYQKLEDVELFTTPHWGYTELHKYYNLLAKKSTGDWLMLWNDDGFMETENWFELVTAQDHTKRVVLNVFHEVNNLFPLISRPFYETIGHFSLNTHADSWVQQIGERSGTQVHIPGITIIHNKPEDKTGWGSTSAALETGAQFNSIEMQTLINADAEKIRRGL